MRRLAALIWLSLQLPLLHSMNNIDAVSLLDSAEVYRHIDLEKSHEFADQLISVTTTKDFVYCEAIRSKCITFSYEGKMDSAKVYNDKLPTFDCYEQSLKIRFKYHSFKAKLLIQRGEIDSSLAILNTALEIANMENNPDWKIEALGGIGVTYYRIDRYKEALSHYLMAETLFDQASELNDIQKCNIVHNMGASFDVIGDYDRAHKYLIRALNLAKERPVQRVHCLFSLGALYANMDSFELAEKTLQESIELNDNNPYFKAFSHVILAELLETEQQEESYQFAIQAYDTFSEMNDHQHASQSSHIISAILLKQKKYTKAEKWIRVTKGHALKSTSPVEINKAKLLELEYLLHINVGSESAEQLRQYQRVSDSLSQVLLDGDMLQLEIDKEMRQAVDTIQTLSLSIASYQSKRYFNRGLIALLCLLLPVLFFLGLRHSKIAQKSDDLENAESTQDSKATTIPSILDQRFIIEGDKHIHTTFGGISSIHAKSGGIEIKLTDGTTSFIWTSLSKYINLLPEEYFIRVSKFHIINIAQIDSIVDYMVKLKNGDQVKYSPAYKERFINAYELLEIKNS